VKNHTYTQPTARTSTVHTADSTNKHSTHSRQHAQAQYSHKISSVPKTHLKMSRNLGKTKKDAVTLTSAKPKNRRFAYKK